MTTLDMTHLNTAADIATMREVLTIWGNEDPAAHKLAEAVTARAVALGLEQPPKAQPKTTTRHAQKRVPAPAWDRRKRIRVDEEMAPLLRELWRCGFSTWASCQDWGDDTAMIVFDDGDGIEQGAGFALLATGEQHPPGWRFSECVNPYDPTGLPNCAVYFPRELLLTLPARMAAALTALKS